LSFAEEAKIGLERFLSCFPEQTKTGTLRA
jgi:hypothetical protein